MADRGNDHGSVKSVSLLVFWQGLESTGFMEAAVTEES
jgi:hypothetical protein